MAERASSSGLAVGHRVPNLPYQCEKRWARSTIGRSLRSQRSSAISVVGELSALIAEISRTPEVRGKLFQQGWQAAGTSAEGLANRIQSDTATLGGVIMMRGITAQ